MKEIHIVEKHKKTFRGGKREKIKKKIFSEKRVNDEGYPNRV